MALITERQATTGQLIDDVADAATGLAEWSDADTAVTNEHTSTAWRDNGRVLYHEPSGQYLTLAIQSLFADIDTNNDGPSVKGVRICTSNDWDSEYSHPAGKTETQSDDPWAADAGFDITDSFEYSSWDTDNDSFSESVGSGLYYFESTSGSRAEQATDSVTYFASVGADYLNIAAWNTTDGADGAASYFLFENVDNKFWSDGADPYAVYSQSTAGVDSYATPFRIGHYGYRYWDQETAISTSTIYNTTGFDMGEWGILNPDANDDTFFFQRPVIYQSSSERVPVAYIEDAIPNDTDEGGAHGDIITHDGTDYRVFRQTGAGETTVHSCGMRYE